MSSFTQPVSGLRIGILTYHFSMNYGALLQAYALREWLRLNGHHAFFVDYRPQYVESHEPDWRAVLLSKSAREIAKTAVRTWSESYRRLFHRDQIVAFETFRREYLGIGVAQDAFIPNSAKELDCDLLICGSDQIWNPGSLGQLDPIYFLNFQEAKHARRVSYAASFGTDDFPAALRDQAAFLLRQLHAISVREASGVKIVNEVSGLGSVSVPDPTLLLRDYTPLLNTDSNQRSGHVFCYALRSADGMRNAAKWAAKRGKVPVISPFNPLRRWREIGSTVYPGPLEWVRLIWTSSFVVTNSFHGVALSILLGKQFLAIGLPGQRAGLNSRVLNLLNQVGLLHRFVTPEACTEDQLNDVKSIDWPVVQMRVAEYRHLGELFLRAQVGSCRETQF